MLAATPELMWSMDRIRRCTRRQSPRWCCSCISLTDDDELATLSQLERFRLKRNRRTALFICFYALSYAKPLRAFAGNALVLSSTLHGGKPIGLAAVHCDLLWASCRAGPIRISQLSITST